MIIDAPPLLPVTDSAVLAHQADGAILVVGLGKTTYDLVIKAQDALAKASGRLLGIVLNRAPLKGADASPYYDYRGGYQASAWTLGVCVGRYWRIDRVFGIRQGQGAG